MTTVQLRLPTHAVRYLAEMCKRERQALARELDGPSLQAVAAFDSLEAIENALPPEVVG